MASSDEMFAFLIRKGVSEDIIDHLKREKVDPDVILKLGPDNAELARHLCLGDRTALHSFCVKKETSSKESERMKKKKKCYASIRKKLKLASRDSDDDSGDDIETSVSGVEKTSKVARLTGNSNASKSTRAIEIGWVHNGVGVRRPNGGGTRKTTILKSCTAKDVMLESMSLFFPDGVARKGVEAEKCKFCLHDFTHNELSPDTTVGALCDTVKMSGKLRFYLNSSGPELRKHHDTNIEDPLELVLPDLNKPVFTSTPEGGQLDILMPDPSLNQSLDKTEITEGTDGSLIEDLDIVFGPGPCTSTSQSDTLPLTNDEINMDRDTDGAHTNGLSYSYLLRAPGTVVGRSVPQQLLEQDTFDEGSRSPQQPTPPYVIDMPPRLVDISSSVVDIIPREVDIPPNRSENIKSEVRVRRVALQNDMIAIFVNPNITYTPITVTFVDERGCDEQGVSRDAYTSFWADFLNSSAKGEVERVPSIMPHLQHDDWEAIGRILVKGFLDHGVFPIQLSKAFVIAMLYGEQEVSSDILMDSFMHYVSAPEQVVINKALNGTLEDDDDRDDFADMLSRMDCQRIPFGDQVKPVLLQVAQAEIIQQSKYALDAIASVAREPLVTNMPQPHNVLELYEAKKPTCRKVLKLVQVTTLDSDENRIINYLKQLIRGFSPDMLVVFLQYSTGAQVICTDKIGVCFNNTKGLSRAPIARTCGPVLELSTTYTSYAEFRQEFMSVISKHSGKFDLC